MKKVVLLIAGIIAMAGCTTRFTGDAHITPQQCIQKCTNWGLEMSSMIAMGEYSDACVCSKKGQKTSAVSSGAGAVGVVMQMREQQRQQQQNASMMHH